MFNRTIYIAHGSTYLLFHTHPIETMVPNNYCQCFNPTAKFLKLIHHAALEPPKKYREPQTESQEIGWFSTPLVSRISGKAKYCGTSATTNFEELS